MSAPTPLTIRGTTYPSLRAASAALGVDRTTLRTALRRGTLDDVGQAPANMAVPITVNGMIYPSIKAAARSLGRDPSTVCNALNRGTLENIGKGRGTCKRDPAKNGREIRITVMGRSFRSLAALSAACGYNRRWAATLMARHGREMALTLIAGEMARRAMEAEAKGITQRAKAEGRASHRAADPSFWG